MLAKACLRRMILQRRKETWRQFCGQMEQGEYTKAIAKFCKVRKNRTLKPSFSTIEGPQHAANVMASHLRSIYSGHLLQEADRTFPSLGNPTTPFEIETCPITLEDIHTSLKRLPLKKAPGIDHVRQEMLIPIQNQLTPILLFLFRLCWAWSYTQVNWRIAQVVPIYKKGDPSEPGNHRPISLTSIFRKLLEYCLQHFLADRSPPWI
ncbi:hypothetical protein G6F43_013242 [Rhizopus delemar]|nr:hypothetical protein G6F43_013242 [Rhizopus delemar]